VAHWFDYPILRLPKGPFAVVRSTITAVLIAACWLVIPSSLPSCLHSAGVAWGGERESLRILFLGDDNHHRPFDRFAQLEPLLTDRGIAVVYTKSLADLTTENLSLFDGLIIFANHERIEPSQERAVLDFVAEGKALIALHCASYCFLNSDAYIQLVGGQFKSHGGEVFRTEIALPEHPIMAGFGGFQSWDETYVHHRHGEGRTILEYRVQGGQGEGNEKEPYTWVREHGKGRVFYTAWGHDERTWGEPGFVNLVHRGILWACRKDPSKAGRYPLRDPFVPLAMTPIPEDLPALEFEEVGAKIPNYVPSEKWGVQGSPLTKMQRPLPSDASMQRYSTPVGFRLERFASEPQLEAKPIAMAWDEQGKLWVCETVDYPNELRPQEEGRDRIQVLEDSDGDHVADRFTTFADRLSIPTSILPYRGGVVVQAGTETLYLKDTDGDRKADQRTTLIRGWAMGDTHGGVSNFRYGLDNWVWAMQGYNDSTPIYAGNKNDPNPQSFRQGFFRFKLSNTDPPEVTELEFVRSTNNNTWGLGISEDGLIFGSTANRNPSDFMPIANRYYENVRGWSPERLEGIADSHLFDAIMPHVRQVDHHGGYTAGCGHALYTARNYPSMYWNRTAFVCEPTGHIVGTFDLQPKGAGFYATSPCNLIASNDDWAAPIQAEVGPDGNVWVLDWYNFIVQHNPTPIGFETGKGNAYETDLRDKVHGRIYRVVYGDKEGDPTLQLPDMASRQLVRVLGHPNMLWRLHSQWQLVQRDAQDSIPLLIERLADRQVDAIGLNPAAIHCIWTLQGLGALDQSGPAVTAVADALSHPSAGVRRNAIAALPPSAGLFSSRNFIDRLSDEDAQVRLAALLKVAEARPEDLRESQVPERLAALMERGDVLQDRWLRDALTCAASASPPALLGRLVLASRSTPRSESMAIVERVAEHWARRDWQSIHDAPSQLTLLSDASDSMVRAIVTGLNRGWPKDSTVQIPDSLRSELTDALPNWSIETQGEFLRLANRWGSDAFDRYRDELVTTWRSKLVDANQPASNRGEAALRMMELATDDSGMVVELIGQLDARQDPELASGLVQAIASSRSQATGVPLIEAAKNTTPAIREQILRAVLGRPAWTNALLDAAENETMSLGDLALDQRQSLAAHPDKTIRQRAKELLAKGGGVPNADRQAVVEKFIGVTQQSGDPVRGKALYTEHCSKCHRHSGQGIEIGPELTGMAVHPKAELLVHILDPSRSVEGNFRTYSVVTEDGMVINGMMAGESKTAIEVIDTAAKKTSIQRSDIAELQASPKSVMPEGFEEQLKEDGLRDLLEFLTQRGKYLPLDIRKVATVSSLRPMFYGTEGEFIDFKDWSTKTFEGVPFSLVDPQQGRVQNCLMFYGPIGKVPPTLPREVTLPVGGAIGKLHFLGGIGGWSAQGPRENGSVSLVVQFRYADGATEEHPLRDGVELADYIGRFDVPASKFAFDVDGRQVRYHAIEPKRSDPIESIVIRKGDDKTAPIIFAITAESP
jgi:uncharacterized protein